jgi:poly-gamma-glutamate synthase PgsB/CapB
LKREEAQEILTAGMNACERKANRRLVGELVSAFLAGASSLGARGRPESGTSLGVERLLAFLKAQAEESLNGVFDLRRRFAEYTKRYARATSFEDRERHVMAFARDLGASARELRGDRKALSRWFDHDAVVERYRRRVLRRERRMTFVLERIGVLAERILRGRDGEADLAGEWRLLLLEQALKPFFVYEGDSRVSVAAFRCLSRALTALPEELRERCVDESTLQFIYRSAMHPRLDVWLQCEALALLEKLSLPSLEKVLVRRLTQPAQGDDLFVRRRAVQMLGTSLERLPRLADLFPAVSQDPSPFVRQALAGALRRASEEIVTRWLPFLSAEDPVPQVRAAALLEGLELLGRPELRRGVLECLEGALRSEKSAFVLRVAAHVAATGAARLVAARDPFADVWCSELIEALERVHVHAESIPVRRWAAMARDRVWCEMDARARELRAVLETHARALRAGERRLLPPSLFKTAEEDTVGRVLSVLAQEDFGYALETLWSRPLLRRGDVFGFRWWRLLHELRHPAPDKRQAHRHTTGRVFRGTLRAPSSILGELAQTRVPGEPYLIAEEGGWRPYLPLPDEVLSSLTVRAAEGPVRIYTSEGVTELLPPRSLARRLEAWCKLTLRFPAYARLRNWTSRLQESPSSYSQALEELGFNLRLRPHGGATEDAGSTALDPAAERFFPGGGALAAALPFSAEALSALAERLERYFVSVYENSLFELALFIGGACTLFGCKHLYANFAVRRCRERMPLVIGGWGTRGKSGTERLKAALFNALGYGLVSKTTGCEAMFLYAHPFGATREMFLFRSYDKATIWEQKHVLALADKLGAEVFLWECMALTPSYVDVLQGHWVRDDISTITNTYPDHEDLQGPAGHDIPKVIARFIPRGAKVVTTEGDMLPILVETARDFGTELTRVTWLDCGLIAPDVLARFPYEEHPNNIALVLALADELGVDRDFALKEMADRVVADLGVLKTSPIARVRGRRLQFANGCSANERHGSVGNWIRLGFDRQDPVAEPGVWITTVVNNRADRVPRSQVFARVIVEDMAADRHVLIGGNLRGLVGYVHEAWAAFAGGLSLWPAEGEARGTRFLETMARRFRQPTEERHVEARLGAMLAGLGLQGDKLKSLSALWRDPGALRAGLQGVVAERLGDAVLLHLERETRLLREYAQFRARVEKAGDTLDAALDEEFRGLLWKWYEEKIVVVEDYYVSGDQLIALIAEATPPGFLNRVMGIQNIKGTGLEFVYCWQAWDTCHKACVQLRSREPQAAERGLRALAAFKEYGILCKEHVEETLEAVRGAPASQSESFQAELAVILSNFTQAMAKLGEKLSTVQRKASRLEKLVSAVEAFFDAGDAVRRRKMANRIYRDLVDERVSGERAALLLQALNKRQKGGWLGEKLMAARRVVSKMLRDLVLRRLK